MNSIAVMLVSCLCMSIGWAAATPPQVASDADHIVLKPGQSAESADGRSRIGFVTVVSDSRCPKGVQCIWAGDAVARIWLERSTQSRVFLELHTLPGQANRSDGVRLVRLDPTPAAGSKIDERDYVLTVTFAPDKPLDPDR